MCKFQIQSTYNKKQHKNFLTRIRCIPTGSIVFVKWYHRKSHKMFRTHGILISKRLNGLGVKAQKSSSIYLMLLFLTPSTKQALAIQLWQMKTQSETKCLCFFFTTCF